MHLHCPPFCFKICNSGYKINKYKGCNVQHDSYNDHNCCMVYMKGVKRVNLKGSYEPRRKSGCYQMKGVQSLEVKCTSPYTWASRKHFLCLSLGEGPQPPTSRHLHVVPRGCGDPGWRTVQGGAAELSKMGQADPSGFQIWVFRNLSGWPLIYLFRSGPPFHWITCVYFMPLSLHSISFKRSRERQNTMSQFCLIRCKA